MTAVRIRLGLLVALAATGVSVSASMGAASQATTNGSTIAVSVGPNGQLGNSWGGGGDITADGRYIVFCSYASNLVSGDTNGQPDVFRRDVTSGTTTLVSAAVDGTHGNGSSCGASMSADGRYVAFDSQATNLTLGTDTNGQADVLVKDLLTGLVTRASVASDGTPADDQAAGGSISADGRYVVFDSFATNLAPNEPHPGWKLDQVYVRDLLTGTTTLASVSSAGVGGNGVENEDSSISADGRYVAFSSYATNLVPHDTNKTGDVFVHDMTTGATTRVSVDSHGRQADSFSAEPRISADGRYVIFTSDANNLIAGRRIATEQAYLHDMQTGRTTLISASSGGTVANRESWAGSITSNDRYVTFTSDAANLVPCDSNGRSDGFVRDLQTGTTTRVSLSSVGGQLIQGGGVGGMTPDGRFVVMNSWSSDVVPGDRGGFGNAFLHDTQPGTMPAAPRMGVTRPEVRANVTAVPVTGCSAPGTTIHLTVRDSKRHLTLTLPVRRGQWSTKLDLRHFANGYLTVMAYATSSAGVTSARTYTTLLKDLIAPTARITKPDRRYITRNFGVQWTGSDKGGGIASYDLRWRHGRSRLSAYSYVVRGTPQVFWGFGLDADTTYCWSVRAHDRAGNVSAWSPDRCGTTQ